MVENLRKSHIFSPFLVMQQALENKLRNKKMAAARAGWKLTRFAPRWAVCSLSLSCFLSFFSPKWAFDAEWHCYPNQTIPHSYCPPSQPFSRVMSRGFGWLPVGERQDSEKSRSVKFKVVIEKLILQIQNVKNKSIESMQIADTNAYPLLPINDHCYT